MIENWFFDFYRSDFFTVLANIFIMRRSAANKVLEKKEQEQPEKNAQKLSAEINSEILFSSPLV